MSLQGAEDFIRKAAGDAELGARVAATVKGRAGSAAAAALSALGCAEGFDFTPEEAVEARNRILQAGAMPESELEAVAGGMYFSTLPPEINSGRIYAGPGSGPLLAASSAWEVLAAELQAASASEPGSATGICPPGK